MGENKRRREQAKRLGLGATGRFPRGKLSTGDEGKLAFALGVDSKGNIIMNFGKPVMWVGFPKPQAIDIAMRILQKCGVSMVVTPKIGGTTSDIQSSGTHSSNSSDRGKG